MSYTLLVQYETWFWFLKRKEEITTYDLPLEQHEKLN
jgi:hypothetical protein